jgi:S-adenosylmethionine:tRNA ribosyltransferase-isomerase
MNAHPVPRRGDGTQPLLVVDPQACQTAIAVVGDMTAMLRPGDIVVVNDAATMPASLVVHAAGRVLELRLAGPPTRGTWPAVLFGEGDWHTDTDRRPAPPRLDVGDVLSLDDGTPVVVREVSSQSSRLLGVAIDRDEAHGWQAVYRCGRAVQYAYMTTDVALDDVQTRWASRPWAAEMPSAGRPIALEMIAALRRAGIVVAALTHAAGLSATGDPALDRLLPLPERYELPVATVEAIARARTAGGRVVAVGTSVVRALEDNAARNGELVAGEWVATLVLGPTTPPRVVDGVLSGVHEPGTSHHALLAAFASDALLRRANEVAVRRGLGIHEFGDSSIVLRGAVPVAVAA